MQNKLTILFTFAIFVLIVGLHTDSYACDEGVKHKTGAPCGGGDGGGGGLSQCRAELNICNDELAACLAEPNDLFPASGQTTVFQADKNNGAGLDAVDDDGTVRAGAPLSYTDNEDGTITDNNTGLMWEKKVAGSGCLHCVNDTFRWSGNGSQETIWDWLDDVNAEGGTGFARHNDWRIPNAKELPSIVDYERTNPSIDPIFGPTDVFFYWSSTTFAINPSDAWNVIFNNGNVNVNISSAASAFVRSVAACDWLFELFESSRVMQGRVQAGGPHRAAVFVFKVRRTQFISSLIESWGSKAEQTQAQSGSEL